MIAIKKIKLLDKDFLGESALNYQKHTSDKMAYA